MTTSVPSTQGGFANNPSRGIASLNFGGKVLRFRTNPNEIWWSYGLNTSVEDTYGGRVVQILSTRIEDLVIKIDCGWGGWPELNRVVDFLRTMMIEQRKDGGKTAVFNYTTRRWRMKVYALSVPFQDAVNATTRELEIRFKVVEDLTGEMTSLAMQAELARLQDGMNFRHNEYNTPNFDGRFRIGEGPAISPTDAAQNIISGLAAAANGALGALPQVQNAFIPNLP